MSQKLYSVYDIRSKQFGIPFVQHNDGLAKRTVAASLVNCPPDHLMLMFSGDFELYYLGEVMDNGDLVSPENGAQNIAFVNDIVSSYKVESVREKYYGKGVIADDVSQSNEQTESNAE